MADIGDLISTAIANPWMGVAIGAGTVAVTLGGYWLYRNDDGKRVTRATKVVFGLALVLVLSAGGVLIARRAAPAPTPPESAPAAPPPPAATPEPAAVEATPVAIAQAQCKPGFVWREAGPADLVCVTPEVRERTREENRLGPERRDPNAGSGPLGCQSGYVWREAYSGDAVCVPPDTRDLVFEDNRLAPSRRVAE